MKRTILIPTDFSAASLEPVEHVIVNTENAPLDIVLTHFMFLPDSIVDLLFFSKIETIRSLRNPAFKKAYRTLRLRHAEKDVLLRTDLFTGWRQSAFNHFIDGNQIDEAVIPKPYKPTLNLQQSFDPIPFIRNSRLKITEVELYPKNPSYA